MSGNFIFRHHVEPRVKLYSPREESFSIPLKHKDSPELLIQTWMSNKRNASMIIGISMDQEICLILGKVFTQFTLLSETSRRIFVVR